ncbi:MAG: efflux RND transporter periplasmic adaptor subunit [Acidobacteriia bacterium]|nr:efflux RND transporter periplasmic adaptor subunit [Terriglobia bacterium]MYC67343.1 efflux RND transporter periplasmic adaptor subunit [Terriglobia bacterium]
MTKPKAAALVVACVAVIVAGIAIAYFGVPVGGTPAENSLGPESETAGRHTSWASQIMSRAGGVDSESETAGLYTCGMHPQVALEGPGQCPICGMNLVPIASPEAPDEVEQAGVRVSKSFLQNFGVRTTAVERADLPARIRTIGYLDQDEAKLVSVSTKYGGWIENPRVSTVGERVSEGDTLFEIYSPGLVTAQEEFLASIEYLDRLKAADAYTDAVRRAEALVQAATERLRSWDLTNQQIDELRSAGRVSRTLEAYSPASGYVVEKMADSLEGVKTAPGMTILKIADHSTLWAKVEFYEHYLRDLRAGMRAEISIDAFPGRKWHGRLLFFEPAMNPQTQTLAGYVEVENLDGRLRPKMYATIEFRLAGAKGALVVPAQSVLRSGDDRNVVIVDAGDGVFVPHEVDLGIESEGLIQIVDGLAEGERVVTSSQFLLDSESNLQVAIDRLSESSGHDGHSGH